MRKICQLLKLHFLTPYALLLLYRAKKKHGNNLCFLLKFAADYYTDKIAVADEHTRLNFKQLYEKVLALSFVIKKHIPRATDVTAMLVCNNSVNHILALYALQNSGMKLVLVNDKLLPSDIQKIVSKQSGDCIVFGSASAVENSIDVDELIAATTADKPEQYFSRANARVVFPTSGTTGDVKLIEKKSGEFYWLQSFADLVQRTAIDKRSSVYIAVPVSHGFGYTALLFTLVLGKKAVITSEKNTLAFPGFMGQEKVDILVGVPTALYKVAGQLAVQHTVHTIISGGAALNETVFNKLAVLTNNIFSMYGSTETSTSFIANYEQLKRDVCALGTPLKGVNYRLQPLPGGEKELIIQSPLSNAGSRLDWIGTGDLVEETATGDIIWRSRKDDMIIKMGVNIYPIEIEKELMQLACVEDAYVTGERDAIKGEIIIAFIKLKPGSSFDEAIIIKNLRFVLPGIKIPDKLQVVERFNYTSTGKKVKPLIFNILAG